MAGDLSTSAKPTGSLMGHKRISVFAEWDPEAGTYVATSGDVPGLVAEGENYDLLLDNLNGLIPELLELNAHLVPDSESPDHLIIVLLMKRETRLPAHA